MNLNILPLEERIVLDAAGVMLPHPIDATEALASSGNSFVAQEAARIARQTEDQAAAMMDDVRLALLDDESRIHLLADKELSEN